MSGFIEGESRTQATLFPERMGFTPSSRTYPKRSIMAPEVCHAETKKVLRGV
jgi:hypothetical protein